MPPGSLSILSVHEHVLDLAKLLLRFFFLSLLTGGAHSQVPLINTCGKGNHQTASFFL